MDQEWTWTGTGSGSGPELDNKMIVESQISTIKFLTFNMAHTWQGTSDMDLD